MPDDRPRPRWVRGTRRVARAALPVPAVEALGALEARIKPDFKIAVGAGAVSLASLIIGVDLGGVHRPGHSRWIPIGLTIAFVVFGAECVRSTGRELNRIARARAGVPAASALRTLCLVFGMFIIVLGTLQLLDVDLRTLLLGGAITGVVVGIAAQQPLSNFFAGLVLLFARPYVPGQYVRIRSGSLGGPFEGTITYAGLMYTIIDTDEGRVNLPNAGLLAAAIGPVPTPPLEPDPDSQL
jgi:small-conductance mechanosensitive channel